MLKSHSCVSETAGADGSGRWILWMTTSLSSNSTSATASVSELSHLVTHTAIFLPKYNSEKKPLPNSALRMLFKMTAGIAVF